MIHSHEDDLPVSRARFLMSPFNVRAARQRRRERKALWIFAGTFALFEAVVIFLILQK